MSIAINQAVTLTSIFRHPELKDAEHGGVKIGHLKQLSEADRKICFNALKMLKKGQLSDWEKDAPADKIDDSRIQDIGNALLRDPVDTDTPWYKKPFIWIAKVVKNIFMGRISSKKLYVEASNYLAKVKEAPKVVKKLQTSRDELGGKIESSREEMFVVEGKYDAFEARRGILHKIRKKIEDPARYNRVVINKAHQSIGEKLRYDDIKTDRQIVREILRINASMLDDVTFIEDEAEIVKDLLAFKDLYKVADKNASDVVSDGEQGSVLHNHLESLKERIGDEQSEIEADVRNTEKMIRDLEAQAENELEKEAESQYKTLNEWLPSKITNISEPWCKTCENLNSLKKEQDLTERKMALVIKKYI